jgi:hypothetical protein
MSAITTKLYEAKLEDMNETERTVTSIISTEAIDRDEEIVLASGADLESYRTNPTVLWCHDYRAKPHAKNLWIRQYQGPKGDGLIAKTQYATTPAAEEIWQLRKGGFLKGYSIGFIPKKGCYGPPTEEEIKSKPEYRNCRCVIRKWELLEYSDCNVPSNRDAVSLAYFGKSLSISEAMAKELGIPEKPPAAPEPEKKATANGKVYFLSDTTLRKGMVEELEDLDLSELTKSICEKIPAIVQEQFRLAKGGV